MASLINGLGGSAGFGEYQLTRNDDSYQSGIDITSVFGSTGLNFFGTNYTSISVNNNGNITFGSGMSTYTPYGMQSSSRAMIAPFFADVDTRGGTTTATAGGTSKGTNLVHYDLNSTGYGTLTVTWDDVGYYSSRTDKLNAFQLQLVGKGNGNFDVIIRYESINWTTGSASGGTNGLGGTVARAGYSTGNGATWYELSQSGNQDAMLNLENTLGNTGVAGYYRFSVTSGTSGNDTLQGTSGNDSLYGSLGNDTIYGYAGNDVLSGGGGTDRLVGGLGDDTYMADALDTIVELAGQGTDTVQAGFSYTLAANVENLVLTGTSSINGTGNSGNNTIIGNSGNNVFNGGAGLDFASFQFASSYYGVTVDLSNTGSQYTSHGYDTFVSIEGLIGSAQDDHLTGNSASNWLDGGAGHDTLAGGLGNDTYYIDNVYDVVNETSAGGIDTLVSSVTRTLGSYQENLFLSGSAAINAIGNTLANTLVGNGAANVLNGSSGADTMTGGNGNDTYYVDHASDVVNETSSTGGIDTIASNISRALGNYQENLVLFGTTAINGTGNAQANSLVGNSAANVLTGGAGNDTLSGAAGNDRLIGGIGKDVLTGGTGYDIFDFNALNETGLTSTTWDVITDFVRGQDKIDLSTLDANTATLANDAFTAVIGSASAFTAAGQLKVVNGVLYGNTDADNTAEFAIQLTGISSLTTADFVL